MSELTSGPVITRASERDQLLWAGGTVFDVVLDGSQTEGTVALLDQRGRHGDTTPMHVHRGEAEIFYVIEGAVTAWAGDQVHEIETGGAVYLPADQPHALGISSERARVITVTAPAGFAAFVRAAGTSVRGDVPATWEFDVDAIMAAAPLHRIDIVGPPPPMPVH